MPDITMCAEDDCPRRHKCYRYMAKPNTPWQSYFNATRKGIIDYEHCEYFIPMPNKDNSGEQT